MTYAIRKPATASDPAGGTIGQATTYGGMVAILRLFHHANVVAYGRPS